MRNYRYDKLIEHISKINQPPDDDTTYAAWITASRHLDLLQKNAEEDEVIIHACGQHIFIHTVTVNEDASVPLDIDDLLDWNRFPFSAAASYIWDADRDDIWITQDASIFGSETLQTARELIFDREIPGLPGKGNRYFEIAQEYVHLTGIHHLPERDAYCRPDKHGEWEHVVTVGTRPPDNNVSLITFKREPLEEYLVASRSVLVRMFDFTLFKFNDFNGWPDGPEAVVKCDPIFYRQKIVSGYAAYTRGVQIIRPSHSRAEIVSKMKREPIGETTQYVDFIAYDWRNGRISTISTDPCATTNYFQAEGNSLAFELSPAFFNPEVLQKYKSDADKYSMKDRSISCRNSWELRRYDVNEAGQVHAYICDLRSLPYSEQLYWKSFNEEPKAGISKRALASDFKGQWIKDAKPPLVKIKHMLAKWQQSNVPWWTLRDLEAVNRVTPPLTDSRDEWAREFTNLAQLVIEGFETKAIGRRLDELGIDRKSDEKSLALLERVLSVETENGCVQKLKGLRLVQRIRSKVDAHARGTEADAITQRAIQEHGSYADHFEAVCKNIVSELEHIERAFGEGIAEGQEAFTLSKPLSAQIDESTK